MSCGLPVIGTYMGDGVLHEDCVVERDKEQIKEAIKKVLELDEKSIESKKCSVRNQIVERFSKSRMLKSYDKIYNDLINT